MKKILIVLLISLFAAALFVPTFTVYAEEAENDVDTEESQDTIELVGTDLPSTYQARLNYSYLQPAEGGVYLKLSLTFDSGFLTDNLVTAEKAIDDFETHFKNTRYQTTRNADGIIAEIAFSGLTDYYIAVGASGNDKPEKDDSIYRYSWFFIEIETPVNNPFNYNQTVTDTLDLLTDIESDKIQYVYTYSTRYKTVITDGEVTKDNDTYIHTFYMDEDNAPETLIFKQHTVNTAGWYALALVGALALALIISAFGFAKFAKKHKQE